MRQHFTEQVRVAQPPALNNLSTTVPCTVPTHPTVSKTASSCSASRHPPRVPATPHAASPKPLNHAPLHDPRVLCHLHPPTCPSTCLVCLPTLCLRDTSHVPRANCHVRTPDSTPRYWGRWKERRTTPALPVVFRSLSLVLARGGRGCWRGHARRRLEMELHGLWGGNRSSRLPRGGDP